MLTESPALQVRSHPKALTKELERGIVLGEKFPVPMVAALASCFTGYFSVLGFRDIGFRVFRVLGFI